MAKIQGKKLFLFMLFSIALSLILSSAIAETVLRIVKLPGAKIVRTKYDELTGAILYPHSTVIYSNPRGDFVCKKVNSWGYLDIDHKKEKEKNVYRIGFFGDSNTEASYVPFEDTFFRIIEKDLSDYKVECMAFGFSGRSTVQSYLESQRRTGYFNIDLVVYVFCENDPGDNIREITRSGYKPYGISEKDTFRIDNSFRKQYAFKNRPYYRLYSYIKSKSMLIGLLSTRLKLLMSYGVRAKTNEEQRTMATKTKPGEIPYSTDLPSTWPYLWREYAQRLTSLVILKWRDEVIAESRKFAVLYIPRETEMEKDKIHQDSWMAWIESFCIDNNILFINPSPNFIEAKLSGKEIFYDHLTKTGNHLLGKTFMEWFILHTTK